jgi:hypothetical protein
VVGALWAAQVHLHGVPPYRAEAAARLRSGFSTEEAAHRLRRAVLDPVPPTAAALAFELALAEGPDKLQARARQWLAFGDAPFDVVVAQVFGEGAGRDGSLNARAPAPPRGAPRP